MLIFFYSLMLYTMEGEDVQDNFIGDLSQEHLEDKQEKKTINVM